MRRSVKVPGGSVVMLVVLLLSEQAVFADSLSGRILDPQNNVVADVQLRLFDRTSEQLRETTSGSSGGYAFRDIPPGEYLLEARGSAGRSRAPAA